MIVEMTAAPGDAGRVIAISRQGERTNSQVALRRDTHTHIPVHTPTLLERNSNSDEDSTNRLALPAIFCHRTYKKIKPAVFLTGS